MSKLAKVEPVAPGTYIRYDPKQDPQRWVDPREGWLMRPMNFDHPQVFEVKSFIWDKEGSHVTFERRNGTFYMRGEIRDVKFPYPHDMFEVLSEAEAANYRLADQVIEIAHLAASSRKRFKWLMEWIRTWPQRYVAHA